ncbi:MAG: hypothetical protein ACTIJJ_10205 [Galactobacter sp.]
MTDAPKAAQPLYRVPIWAAICLILACVSAPGSIFLTVMLAPYRDPMTMHVATVAAVVMILALVALCIATLRSRRGPSIPTMVLSLLVAASAAGSLYLLLLIAEGWGIRDSAWPRVKHGLIPSLPADVPFLIARAVTVAEIIVGLLGAAGLVVARYSGSWTRRVTEGVSELNRRREDANKASAIRPSRTREPVTYASQPYLQRMISPITWVLILLVAVGQVILLLMGVLGSRSEEPAAVMVLPFLPVFPVLWAVVESLWRPDEKGGVVTFSLIRCIVVPFAAMPIYAAATFTAMAFPAVRHGYATMPRFGIEYDGLLPTVDTQLAAWLGLSLVSGLLFALMGGLVLVLVVVMPLNLLLQPDEAVAGNAMSRKPEHRRRNVQALWAQVVMIPLVFIGVTLMYLYEPRQVQWKVGLGCMFGVAGLTAFIWFRQRVDHSRRGQPGFPVVLNPADKPDAEDRHEAGEDGGSASRR